jgi:hypothetical protein
VTTSNGLVINEVDRIPEWESYGPGVKKIVLGSLEKSSDKEPLSLASLPPDLAIRFPNLTHLHIWNVNSLSALPELPEGLMCLDIRGCGDLVKVPFLGINLETLILEECPNLVIIQATQRVEFAKLDDLDVSGTKKVASVLL